MKRLLTLGILLATNSGLGMSAHADVKRVLCESFGPGTTSCRVGGEIHRARLDENIDPYRPCYYQSTWGVTSNARRIWVQNGCRGIFRVEYTPENGGGNHARPFDMKCESWNGRYNECRTGVYNRSVQKMQTLSGSPCVEGRDWTYGPYVIKVTNGCRAIFRVYPNE